MFDCSFLFRILTVLCCWMCLVANGLWAQESEHTALLEGTQAYKDGNYRTAIDWFGKAIEDNTQSHKGHFNLGNALYKAKRYQEAASQFEQAQDYASTPEAKGAAYYNLGNSRLALAQAQQQDPQQPQNASSDHLKGAIDAYKQALRHNPKDYEAKNNLATAYKLLRQQQPPPPQEEQQNDQNKDDNDNQQNQQEQNQQQQDQQDQQDQGQDEQNTPQQPQSPPEEQQPIDNTNEPTSTESREMTDIEAKRLLEMVEQEDKRVQRQRLERRRSKPRTIEKKW